jgi:hypothetical protein
MINGLLRRAVFMLRFLLASAAAFGALKGSRPALACGRQPPILRGQPRSGNTAVPTDVIPFYDEYAAWLDASRLSAAHFVLTSSTGEVIHTTPTHRQVSIFELTPERPLAPLTRYTLQASWVVLPTQTVPVANIERSIVFTSGAGPHGKMPAAPIAGLQHYVVQEIDGTLLNAGTCIFYQSDLPIEATFFASGRDEASQSDPHLYMGPFYEDLSGVMPHSVYDCVRLRLRAPAGNLSDATVLCRDDGPLLTLTVNDLLPCTSRGLRPPTDAGSELDATSDRSAVPSPDDGPGSAASCSIPGGTHTPRIPAWGMLAGLSLLSASLAGRRITRPTPAAYRSAP